MYKKTFFYSANIDGKKFDLYGRKLLFIPKS